ncbi:hypothetical protein Q3G72_013166 [Acer saccharum]|nr:hypothetical protein Q3G72_013166 [Acer saccharum]
MIEIVRFHKSNRENGGGSSSSIEEAKIGLFNVEEASSVPVIKEKEASSIQRRVNLGWQRFNGRRFQWSWRWRHSQIGWRKGSIQRRRVSYVEHERVTVGEGAR